IDEVTIDDPRVFYEVNGQRQSNLLVLRDNLDRGAPPADTAEPETREPLLIIRKLRFGGGEVQALLMPLDNRDYQLKLPPITMTDLGGSKGAPPAEIARQVISRLLDRVVEEVKARGIGKELEQARQRLGKE